MKETKKMLAIIEKQYREANNEYNRKQQKKFKMGVDFSLGKVKAVFRKNSLVE